ncbi:MAG: hypothetical protein JW944_12330 [Deltaproteobacteria bacterium]|nr:hypothetical protein [Deltaproteobacteria bacterium]
MGKKQSTYAATFAESMNFYFSEHIRSNNQSMLLSLLISRAYIILGPLIYIWKQQLFVLLFLLFSWCLFLYSPEMPIFLFFAWGIFGGLSCLRPKSDILLPHGRKEQFLSGVAAVLNAIFLVLLAAAAFVILSKILSSVIPTFFLMGKTLSFIPLQFKFLFIPVITLPAAGALFILFPRKQSIVMLALFFIMMISFKPVDLIFPEGKYTFSIFSLFIIILLMLLSLGFHLAVLYYTCMKKSFSGSGR